MPDRTAPKKLLVLIDEFKQIPERDLRAELLIEYAEQWKRVPEEIAKPPYPESQKIPACESEAYVFTEKTRNNSLKYHFAIENPQGISAMAMAAIIDETISGADLEEIASVSDEIIFDFFGREISMGKGLGLRNMVQVVRDIAKSELLRSSPQ